MGLGSTRTTGVKAGFNVFSALGKRDGFAIDFIHNRMVVNDAGNPSNTYDGDPQNKLTTYGADSWQVDPQKGLDLDAARDFAVAIAKANFPYDPAGIHVERGRWCGSAVFVHD